MFFRLIAQSTEQKMEASPLSYSPSIPDTNSYVVIENKSGDQISEEILLMINFHRRNEDYTWDPTDGVSILIVGMNNLKLNK